jgi:hypothetical protein
VSRGLKGDRQLARRDAAHVVEAAARSIRDALVESARDPAHFAVGSWRADAVLATLRECKDRRDALAKRVARSEAGLASERAQGACGLAADYRRLLSKGDDDAIRGAAMRRYVRRRDKAEAAHRKLRAEASAAEAALSFASAVANALPAPPAPPTMAAASAWLAEWQRARQCADHAAHQLAHACRLLANARALDRRIVARVRDAQAGGHLIGERQQMVDAANLFLHNAVVYARAVTRHRRLQLPAHPQQQPLPPQHQPGQVIHAHYHCHRHAS